jgi:hypothetical protein
MLIPYVDVVFPRQLPQGIHNILPQATHLLTPLFFLHISPTSHRLLSLECIHTRYFTHTPFLQPSAVNTSLVETAVGTPLPRGRLVLNVLKNSKLLR